MHEIESFMHNSG